MSKHLKVLIALFYSIPRVGSMKEVRLFLYHGERKRKSRKKMESGKFFEKMSN